MWYFGMKFITFTYGETKFGPLNLCTMISTKGQKIKWPATMIHPCFGT